MNKIIFRSEVLNIRNNLLEKTKKKYDNIIFEALIKSDIYKKAQRIFIYMSFGSEVDTKEIIRFALSDDKEIYVPKTDKKNREMIAVKINAFDNLVLDKYGILEPKEVEKNMISNNFDLIIMPGIAFDKVGNRIGYGAGYYDKYIATYNISTTLLALAYELQIIEYIHSEPHDMKVNYILSEKGLRKI